MPEANASVSTIPKLSPPSDGAHSRSASPSSCHFSSSVDAAGDLDALGVEQQRLDLLRGGAGDGEPRVGTPAPRSASKARSSTGRPLRSSARPTKRIRSASLRARAVRAAPRTGPRRSGRSGSGRRSSAAPVHSRRLGDGDARAQLGVQAARADEARGEPVREPGWSSRCGTCRPPATCAASVAYQLTVRRRSARARGRRRSRRGEARGRAGRPTWGRSRGSTPRRSSAGRACGPAGPRGRAGAAAAGARRGGVTRAIRSSGS